MSKVILLKGLPASGKSTRAREYMKKNPHTIRVNKDLAREQHFFSRFTKAREKVILNFRNYQIHRALLSDRKYDVIVDDTNLHPKHEEEIREIAKEYDTHFEVKFFDAGLETCLERNKRREKSVPDRVIKSMHAQAVKDGFEFKEYPVETYEGNPEKPSAVIFDIDGTLAHMKTRGPYDWGKVGEDEVDHHVAELSDFYDMNGYIVIIMTGRDGVCKEGTLKWLEDNDICYDEFFIREEGDDRPDYIAKSEMFDKVKDKYNIKLVVDDRKQMVKFWRGLGIKTLQVDWGNF